MTSDNHDHRDPFGPRRIGEGLRMEFSRTVERAITEPGKYERKNDPIVWLIWIVNEDAEYTGIPSLFAICTTEDSCRYHVGMLLEQNEHSEELRRGQPRSEQWFTYGNRMSFYVERAPCDHQFGSSVLSKAQDNQIRTPPIKIARSYEFGGD